MKQRPSLHFRRIEVKYFLPLRLICALKAALLPYVEGDPFLLEEGKGRTSYPVCSLYYDSADLQAFQEKLAGILSRNKVRLRTYGKTFAEDMPVFVEIKRRWDLAIAKDRFLCPKVPLFAGDLLDLAHVIHVLALERDPAMDLDELRALHAWYNLQPTAVVRYKREPFVSRHDRTFRITIDHDLEGLWMPRALGEDIVCTPFLPGHAILELKCNRGIPQWFHRLIRAFCLERLSVSKYALALQCLHPTSAYPRVFPLPLP